jgi:hypothetical protein
MASFGVWSEAGGVLLVDGVVVEHCWRWEILYRVGERRLRNVVLWALFLTSMWIVVRCLFLAGMADPDRRWESMTEFRIQICTLDMSGRTRYQVTRATECENCKMEYT